MRIRLNNSSGMSDMIPTFEVVCRIEVCASTPVRAATVARDLMMDPDGELRVDVHRIEWLKEAQDYFPNEKRGWDVRLEAASPVECVEWIQSR